MPHIPEWSHALSVRNARLDEQHIVLIELSKELVALVRRAPPTDAPILEVLREFAALLCNCARGCDFLGRWGGEEFLALMPHSTAGAAQEVAERIRQAVEATTLELGEGNARILLLLQDRIDLIDALQALLHRRQHLLLQQGDLLLPIGLLDPGAAQRKPSPQLQDPLDRLEAGFEQQERILLRPAERRGSSRKHGHGIGAKNGAATGPIPVEARRQEGLRLERPGASPRGVSPLSCSGPLPPPHGGHGRER